MSLAAPFRLPDQLTQRDLLAKYFRTLGNPTRLRILELLRERERPVGELVEALATSQPYVSNQLACLRRCGLVTTRRKHRTIYYRLADERVKQILALAESLLSENTGPLAACKIVDSRPSRTPASTRPPRRSGAKSNLIRASRRWFRGSHRPGHRSPSTARRTVPAPPGSNGP